MALFFFAFLQICFYHSWFGILEARGLLAVGTKDLNEALILGLRLCFLFPFFYSEEVVPLMQKEPHDVGWHDTRRHEKKFPFNSILVLIIWEGFLLHSIRRAEIGFGFSGYQEMDSVKRRIVSVIE